MERARNACLRAAGLPLTVVRDEHNAVFVVTEVRLRYRKPAMLDDVISVTLEVDELRGASVTFIHHVLRGEELLVTDRSAWVFSAATPLCRAEYPTLSGKSWTGTGYNSRRPRAFIA